MTMVMNKNGKTCIASDRQKDALENAGWKVGKSEPKSEKKPELKPEKKSELKPEEKSELKPEKN